MKTRLAVAAGALALAGCTGAPGAPAPATAPTTGVPATASATTATTAGSTAGATPKPPATPTATRPVVTLSGTAIGTRPLGSTPQELLDPDLVARLGKPKVSATQLCRLAGDRNRFALVDHTWGGLTVYYGRRGPATYAIGWAVDLDRVPDGFRLADRLPWRPSFAALAAGGGVDAATAGGVKTARLTGRAMRYTGEVGAASPDTVHGGPELTCS